MDVTELFVLAGGVIAILFVLWYFFGERETVKGAGRKPGRAGD